MRDYSLPLLRACVSKASKEDDPVDYIQKNEQLIKSFLMLSFPSHLALTLPKIIPVG